MSSKLKHLDQKSHISLPGFCPLKKAFPSHSLLSQFISSVISHPSFPLSSSKFPLVYILLLCHSLSPFTILIAIHVIGIPTLPSSPFNSFSPKLLVAFSENSDLIVLFYSLKFSDSFLLSTAALPTRTFCDDGNVPCLWCSI